MNIFKFNKKDTVNYTPKFKPGDRVWYSTNYTGEYVFMATILCIKEIENKLPIYLISYGSTVRKWVYGDKLDLADDKVIDDIKDK